MPNIVVIGAGVVGLTSALLLSRDKDNTVCVVARHMPGDYDIEYTSPWAGANVLPMSDAPGSRWERETWPELKRLAANVPEAGIHFQKAMVLRTAPPADDAQASGTSTSTALPRMSNAMFEETPWYSTLMDDFRELPAEDVPPGYAGACEFTSVCINTALYLPWLVGQCRANGVVFRRAVLRHVADAAAFAGLRPQADGTTAPAAASVDSTDATGGCIIVNCSGLLACRLGGVMDTAVQPARGQVVVIRDELSPMVAADHVLDARGDADGEVLYNMMRAGGGGTVVGGTYQVGNWAAQPDPNTAARLLARLAATHPQLRAAGKKAEDLDVVRHGVGLRPYRTGGVRIETERIAPAAGANGPPVCVVHNYGHSSWGYQGSYGCANRVVELVAEIKAGKA